MVTPPHDGTLLGRVATAPLVSGRGVWVRAVPADYLAKAPPSTPPGSPPNPLWPGGTRLTEARYVPRGLCDAYHIAEGTSTALAEFEQVDARPSDPVFGVARTDLLVLRVEWSLTAVLNLCDERVREHLGVDEATLVSRSALLDAIEATGDPHAETLMHGIGRAVYARPDASAIRYPSARRTGGENLVVFTDRLVPASGQFLRTRDPVRGTGWRIP